MPEMKINSRFLLRDGEATRVYISSVSGDYTAFEREIEGNHLSTPDLDLAELVMQAVYKDTFQKYAMSDAIKQADQTAEQVEGLKKTITDSQVVIEEQRKQLKKTEELIEKASGAMLEQADDNADISEHLLIVKYQIEEMAKSMNFTLPTEVPDSYREKYETDKKAEHSDDKEEEEGADGHAESH